MIRDQIIKALRTATGEKEIQLEFSEREEFGNYSTNIAMQIGGENPRETAQEIIKKLQKDGELSKIVEKIEVAGPGFINFHLNSDYLIKNLAAVGESYGKSDSLKGKRIMFEYGDANTHKLPHIGHVFSYIYGESATRILEAAGAQLFRACYQGDVGLHVAKCLWAFKHNNPPIPQKLEAKVELLQKMYQEGSKAYEENEQAKKEIQYLNKEIYDPSSETHDLWLETRSWSLDFYKKFEEKLGIKYDRHYYESEVHEKGKEIVQKNVGKVFEESQGAIIFPGSRYGLHDRVFITKYHTPTYEAKDMYLQKLKRDEWPMDLLIITTANEQNGYFEVIFKALEKLDPTFKGVLKHIGFGMVNLKTGKMSSRTGEMIGGSGLIDITIDEVKKFLQDRKEISAKEKESIAEAVGVGAVKYSFLKNNPLQDTKFDLQESISVEGNSGPYIQYTVARTNSVLQKAKPSKELKNPPTNAEELAILGTLVKFPEVVTQAAEKYAPNIICNYLYELAQKFNTFYNAHKIIDSENEEFRLKLTSDVGIVLKSGLNLLGIESPERM